MKKRLAVITTVIAAVGLVPVVGANAQYAPDPGGMAAFLPGDPGGNQAFKPVKKAKKANKLVHRTAQFTLCGLVYRGLH
jgi:hypothetical protein